MPSPSHPRTVTLAPSHSPYSHATQTIVHALQSPYPHRVSRQAHRQTKDDHMTTHTTQEHRPRRCKSERNVNILQVNINGIKNKTRGAKNAYSQHMQISSQSLEALDVYLYVVWESCLGITESTMMKLSQNSSFSSALKPTCGA